MKEGDELVEIKILVTHESYKKYFKDQGKEIDPWHIFTFIKKFMDIKELWVHKADVRRQSPILHVNVSGSGSSVTDKDWDKDEDSK